ncbi:uncharacterized protein RSE6_14360 [Rhynchosporium secalis]|uniref:Uncharacterized protein n=1 Tax=Rhynchosporium secalis TaxID=38038 RepID=A0A1E1MV35_RHYSE|nr:uncharacterized protein RSE6_14360 [Rhynchosporium secalis]
MDRYNNNNLSIDDFKDLDADIRRRRAEMSESTQGSELGEDLSLRSQSLSYRLAQTYTDWSWSDKDKQVEFKYGSRTTKDVLSPDYIVRNWTRSARSDIISQRNALANESSKATKQRALLEKALGQLKEEIIANQARSRRLDREADLYVFMQTQARAPNYKDGINIAAKKRNRQQILEASNRIEEQRHVKKVRATIREITVFQQLILGELTRNAAIHQILIWVDDRLEIGGRLKFDLFPSNILQDMVSSAMFHDSKRPQMEALRLFFNGDGAVTGYLRDQILTLIEQHYQQSEAQKLLQNLAQAAGFQPSNLRKICAVFQADAREFKRMYLEAREIVATGMIDEDTPPQPEDIMSPLNAEDLIRPKVSLFRTGMSAEVEKVLISRVYTSKREVAVPELETMSRAQTYNEVLTDFFTSPDVFPYFKDTTMSWSLKQFTTEVNLRIMIPVSEELLEAFTGFCHRTGELFYITSVTRQIKPHVLGWETCEDKPIGGPQRKLAFSAAKRPGGIDRVERQLRDCAEDEFPPVLTAGQFQAKMLNLKRPIFGGLIPRSTIGPNDLGLYIDYWSKTGKFFVSASPGRRFDGSNVLDQKIVRVRNGWAPGQDPDFKAKPLLPQSRREEGLLRRIEADVNIVYNQDRVRNALAMGLRILNEDTLYAAVYNRGLTNPFVNEGVSWNQFHLFLRECNVRNRLFRLQRDGSVTILPEGRDISNPNNNRNSVR